jgi:Rieske Fe-S protein
MNDLRVRRRGTGALQGSDDDGRGVFNDAIDRRRFLTIAGCAAALVAAGEWMGSRLEAAQSVPEVSITDATALADGDAHPLVARDGRAVLALELDDGDIVAYDRRCPHLGCPVLWSPQHARFECPCHHAAFDARTGEVLFGPPRRGLTRARVTTA